MCLIQTPNHTNLTAISTHLRKNPYVNQSIRPITEPEINPLKNSTWHYKCFITCSMYGLIVLVGENDTQWRVVLITTASWWRGGDYSEQEIRGSQCRGCCNHLSACWQCERFALHKMVAPSSRRLSFCIGQKFWSVRCVSRANILK